MTKATTNKSLQSKHLATKISTRGERHMGAVVGSERFKDEMSRIK